MKAFVEIVELNVNDVITASNCPEHDSTPPVEI